MPSDRIAIQDAIKAILESVDGVENVYTDEPGPQDSNDVIQMYNMDDQEHFQTWYLRRVSTTPDTSETWHGEVPYDHIYWSYSFTLTLFAAWQQNKSETWFQGLIDDVLQKFKNKRTLGSFSNMRPLALRSIVPGNLHQRYIGSIATFDVTVYQIEQIPAWE